MMQFEPLEAASAICTLPEAENAPYKVVATQFRLLGFEHTQLRRVGDVAIYSQSKPGLPDAYEVVRIQKHAAYSAFGKDFTAGESYPTPAQWGTEGWTYPKLEQAERKFRELVKEHEKTI